MAAAIVCGFSDILRLLFGWGGAAISEQCRLEGSIAVIDLLIVRLIFVAVLTSSAFFLHPFGLRGIPAAVAGALIAVAIVVFEMRVRRITLKRLIGAAAGSLLGIIGAYFVSLVLSEIIPILSPFCNFPFWHL